MLRCFTGTQIRAAERPRLEAGEGPALMRRAAWGLAHHTVQLLKTGGRVAGARVVGLIGKGKNGADTLWALSFLTRRGVAVAAVAINTEQDELHTEATAAFVRAGGRFVTRIPTDTRAVIDGIFGTGFSGSFDVLGYLAEHQLVIADEAAVIACDIPSGVIADTGHVPGTSLVADLTVTFGGPKIGLVAAAGGQHAGLIEVVDIGIDKELAAIENPWWVAEPQDVAATYGPPGWDVHKYSRGVLSVVAGSPEYPGAAVLVANAATATGVGYLNLVAEPVRAKYVASHVLHANPQAVVVDRVTDQATAVVIGPGLGDTADGHQAAAEGFQAARRLHLPVLVDASGLNVLTPQVFDEAGPAMILTPHVGEMARLTARLAPDLHEAGEVEQAARFAQRFGVWVVLKSSTTYLFAPDGTRGVHPSYTAELATAGTGDTLAGILGAGLTTLEPGDSDFQQQLFAILSAGVRLHSMAGELAAADGGVVVSELQDYIRQAKRQGLD